MKIKYKYGLLLVDISLTFEGKNTVIENMVLDTGELERLFHKMQ